MCIYRHVVKLLHFALLVYFWFLAAQEVLFATFLIPVMQQQCFMKKYWTENKPKCRSPVPIICNNKPFIFFFKVCSYQNQAYVKVSLKTFITEESWKYMTGILQLLKDTKTNFEASGYPYHMFFGEVRAVSHMGVFNFKLTVLQVSHLLQLQ